MEDILEAAQFSKDGLEDVLDHADFMRDHFERPVDRLPLRRRKIGHSMAALFYEPSTRTRMSFVSAAHSLGMDVVETENAELFSSAAKGETLEDSIRVVGGYADVIVIRHKEKGAAKRAAAVSPVPIINAGDGTGEHPTQALLDAHTIRSEKGRLDNLHVVMGGDLLHGRTARSLAQLLALYKGNHITFVSTPELQMGTDVTDYLIDQGISYTETDDVFTVLPAADVVYWTRLQKERLTNPALQDSFTIGEAALRVMKRDAIIMHPLPRVGEIETVVDSDPRAAYFRQAQNGLYVRQALLDNVPPRS